MNRVIRFRAWDDKKMDYNPTIDGYEHGFVGINTFASQQEEKIELMQFTGLLDKNGKEIYEGDIVKVTYSDGSGYDNPVEVYFENGSFWCGMGYLNNIKIIEVIGNIYENPELLKEIK